MSWIVDIGMMLISLTAGFKIDSIKFNIYFHLLFLLNQVKRLVLCLSVCCISKNLFLDNLIHVWSGHLAHWHSDKFLSNLIGGQCKQLTVVSKDNISWSWVAIKWNRNRVATNVLSCGLEFMRNVKHKKIICVVGVIIKGTHRNNPRPEAHIIVIVTLENVKIS